MPRKKTTTKDDMKVTSRIKNVLDKFKRGRSAYREGISVIKSCGENEITQLLESIKAQRLDHSLFETIIIFKHHEVAVTQEIADFQLENPDVYIRVEHVEDGVGYARNRGLERAAREYITFVDEEDTISPDHLQSMYRNARKNRVVISQAEEVGHYLHTTMSNEMDTPLNSRFTEYFEKLSKHFTGILIPTVMVKSLRYNTNIKSEEDAVFFSKLLSLCDFKIKKIKGNTTYHRVINPDNNPTANVSDRLEAVGELDKALGNTANSGKRNFIKHRIKEQIYPLNQFLHQNPGEVDAVRESVRRKKFNYFPYSELYRGLAKKLVISYCFPPFMDTSGNNMAKRVRESGQLVDVVQNDMANMRKVDHHLQEIAGEFVENQVIVDAEASFGNWNLIHEFVTKGMDELSLLVQRKGSYDTMYSRAMFPASNFLAFEFKLKHPETRWIAELSDPILYDIKSQVRKVEIQDTKYLEHINREIKAIDAPEYPGGNLFFLCEYLAYLFADEVVFTNENQKRYMMDNFPCREVKGMVEAKSTVKKHPILPEEFYHIQKSTYPLDSNYVNFGYFGTFYETRNLDQVYQAFMDLSQKYQDKYRLHLFTSDTKKTKKTISHLPIKDKVRVNDYQSYLEFLNLTTKFQCLIVSDAETRKFKDINPYLPSKLSDYMGSRTDIWSICEEGSILSTYDVKYRSYLDDGSSRELVQQIIDQHLVKKPD